MAADNRSLIELPRLNLDEVLLKLPLPSLFACARVSSPLLNIIRNDPDFARMCFEKSESQLLIHSSLCSDVHLIDLNEDTHPAFAERVKINPSFNLPSYGYEVTHSSNGLVLMENSNMDDDVHRSMVCNPVTGEYIMLPDSTCLSVHVTSAFFYCPVTSQFKIFRVFHRVYHASPASESFMSSNPDPCMELDLFPDGNYDCDSDSDSDSDSNTDSDYSESDRMGEFLLGGSDSWESIHDVPFSPLTIYSPSYLHNATHWLCAEESVKNLIVSFNFEAIQFGEIPAPAHMNKIYATSPDCVSLVPLDGCLSIFDNYTITTRFDVWKMKEYGAKDSWTREFVIDTTAWGTYGFEYFFTPAICRNNGEVVMVSGAGYIVFYNLFKKRGRIVSHPALRHQGKAVAHTPSLMLMSDVFRGNNMVVERVSPRFAQPEVTMRNYLQLILNFF